MICMARPKKDDRIRKEMCSRFVLAMNRLGMSASEVARALGYANATTIAKVLKGEAFVDVERLYLLAQIETADGRRIDLNWLICGQPATRTHTSASTTVTSK
jgi:transcriptional regulator with XRE-family HTH domain